MRLTCVQRYGEAALSTAAQSRPSAEENYGTREHERRAARRWL